MNLTLKYGHFCVGKNKKLKKEKIGSTFKLLSFLDSTYEYSLLVSQERKYIYLFKYRPCPTNKQTCIKSKLMVFEKRKQIKRIKKVCFT